MAIKCPFGCGKKFINEYHAKRHGEVMHKQDVSLTAKRKGWVTPYGFVDFKEPVSYEEALETSKTMNEMFATIKKPTNPKPE